MMVDVVEAKKEKVIGMCICSECPSWIICGETGGFCAVGKSVCVSVEKGCICDSCPVHKKMVLKGGYFCIKGANKSLLSVKKPVKKVVVKRVVKAVKSKKAIKKAVKKIKKPVKKKSRR